MKKVLGAAAALLVATAPAFAQKQATTPNAFVSSTIDGEAVVVGDTRGVGEVLYNVDITGVESWDVLDDPDNTVMTEAIGNPTEVVGVGWNVTIETVGASWLSEARTYFDGSDLDGTGLFLAPGIGNDVAGTATFDSGGILDLSDNMIPNIPTQADGLLYLQFFESFDDVADTVDSTYLATSTFDLDLIGGPSVPIIEVPTASTVGLIALFSLLAIAGVVYLRQ